MDNAQTDWTLLRSCGLGALAAVEQGDLDALKVILSKNSFSVNDQLESGIYGQFSPKFTLLDVALLLNRQHAAVMLLQHGALENPHCKRAP